MELGIVVTVMAFIGTINAFGPKMGPYDINIEKFEPCEDQGTGQITFPTRLNSAGKGRKVYHESFTLGVPIDDKTKVEVEIQKFGNGGWRPKFIQYTMKNCKAIWKMVGSEIIAIGKASNNSLESCPVPAGVYNVDNWEMSLNLEKNIPTMEYGKYRGFFKFHYNTDFVGCIIGYGECLPKETKS
ncbi:uncharacterized protein LOC128988197 [Macrosteles quadrilineatus]|uniref:uncharacterized protein LOC128988197 n=1 Tax=Macrosteles quadrilineatus TaxID=74068 RepID=UPI0023E2D846|nr:uncharacterized protein LOC128988197 [Macrosteles quadrilineatus]